MTWIALFKPRIVLLSMWTTYIGMRVGSAGSRGVPWELLVAVALAGAGAAAWNQILDRELDRKMTRTRRRPLVQLGRVPLFVAFFATILVLVGLGVAWRVQPMASLLLAGAVLLYTPVYTLRKRTDPYAAVYGSAIGALLPVVGVVGVTGHWTLEATWLFAVLFLWQPLHFWALGLMFREEYARAGIPVLPVVRKREYVHGQMALYALALLWLGSWPVLASWVTLPVGVLPMLAGLGMAVLSFWLFWRPEYVRWLFRYSLLYLLFVFLPWIPV